MKPTLFAHASTINSTLLIVFGLMMAVVISSSTVLTGKEKTVEQTPDGNVYIAAANWQTKAVVRGDLIGGGALITVADTVLEDLLAFGSQITVDGVVCGDARVAGANIAIQKDVKGDLVAVGSVVQVGEDVTIHGDVWLAGGYAVIDGTVNGCLRSAGGRVLLKGVVHGRSDVHADELVVCGVMVQPATFAANKLVIKPEAQFHDSLTYWCAGGKMDLHDHFTYARQVEAHFDPSLEHRSAFFGGKRMGIRPVAFWIWYALAALLAIGLWTLIFHSSFSQAGQQVNRSYMRNLGYGMFYFVGLLVAALILCATLIGIPFALLLLSVLGFSLLFATSVTAVVLAYGLRHRYAKTWGKGRIVLVAALIFVALRAISMIPIVGLLVVAILVGMSFGAVIIHVLPGLGMRSDSRH